jgi:hypothetical protein
MYVISCCVCDLLEKIDFFATHLARNEDPNQYVVHDPLLAKRKEKFNKEHAKLRRRNREWAGKSLA